MLKLPSEFVQRLRPFYEGKAVCVTGGAGFIGGHLVDALFGLGATVTVIDDLSNSDVQHVASLVDLDPDRVHFIHGSILEDSAITEAVRGAKVVFHLAAMSSVPRSIDEPERCMVVNTIGTLRVAQAAVKEGVARIVYSASSSAYGDQDAREGSVVRPKVETQAPVPLSPYAVGKLSGEQIMRAWSASYGISTLSLRYFNIFGPRQPADSPYSAVIAVFAKKLMASESPTIFGDGGQSRDFTYVTNAVLANLLAGASSKKLSGEVVNIGSGRAVDLNTLYKLIAASCGVPHVVPIYAPSRTGDVRHSLADLSAAADLIGYVPVATLDEGLETTLAWYRSVFAASNSEQA
ncbi:MAG: SDR family NAD(P)-dependent oxidoreductase [Pyrinomonadaceae bacterium]|nr:SDR family NAD(P)-dependent oxidoreductase [Phycisphaerales bacterium]